MSTKEKYLQYCSDLFDCSINLQNAKKALEHSMNEEETNSANQNKARAERAFLACCQSICNEYEMTNPKTPEVQGLKDFMNAIHQGHYSTK